MDPILGEIKLWALDFAPQGWLVCDGSLLSIQKYTALFSLLGTQYGGDGKVNFGLPDLRGRVPIGAGPTVQMGEKEGVEASVLTAQTVPSHSHQVNATTTNGNKNAGLNNHIAAVVTQVAPVVGVSLYRPAGGATVALAPATVSADGGGGGHNNMQPYLALNYCIAAVGVYPTRP